MFCSIFSGYADHYAQLFSLHTTFLVATSLRTTFFVILIVTHNVFSLCTCIVTHNFFLFLMSLRAAFFSLRMLCIFCKLQLAHVEWRDQEVEEKSCSTVSQAKTLRSLASKWREISQLLIRSFQRRRLQVNHKV